MAEKFAAEGFGTLAEVIEAELTADDLDELGLDVDEAAKFTAAFATAAAPQAVQLKTWLAELDLLENLEKFEAEGFTTLPEVVEAELTEDDLKEIGLGMKARKLIAIELAKIQGGTAAVRVSVPPGIDALTVFMLLNSSSLAFVWTGIRNKGRDNDNNNTASDPDGRYYHFTEWWPDEWAKCMGNHCSDCKTLSSD